MRAIHWIIILFCILFSAESFSQVNKTVKIYKYDIKEEIAPPVVRKTQKAVREAGEMQADYILIHMNTYGGMVDAADSVRTILLNSKIPVLVFIDNNAASAGALISIACDSIYMRSGANIGAATVVNQEGQAMPDKYQSYMRSMMRSTAEKNGRDPHIAEAMVDPTIKIDGITDSGRVVTFTVNEAIKYGFCEGQTETIDELLNKAQIKNYTIIEQHLTVIDKAIGFLTNPFVSGILIIIIIGGIYFEIQSPGVVFPIIAAALAAILYFAPLYLDGLAANWEILIFIIGLVLIGLEIFVVPGFGITGITGIAFVIFGLTFSLIKNVGFEVAPDSQVSLGKSFMIVCVSITTALSLGFYLSSKLFTSKKIGSKIVLRTEITSEQGFTSANQEYHNLVGQCGICKTMLRPSGKIEINGDEYDASIESGFAEKGDPILVVRYENMQLFVRKKL